MALLVSSKCLIYLDDLNHLLDLTKPGRWAGRRTGMAQMG